MYSSPETLSPPNQALCNDSHLSYSSERGTYQRIGEATEVALRVLAEKVLGLPCLWVPCTQLGGGGPWSLVAATCPWPGVGMRRGTPPDQHSKLDFLIVKANTCLPRT